MTDESGKPVDLDGLDYAALKALADAVSAKIEAKRENELKTLVNGWAQKSQLLGLSIDEVIAEFEHYRPKREAKAARAKAVDGGDDKPYQAGVTYRNPAGPETWVGGTKGRQPPWLRELVPDTLPAAERAQKFAELAVKP